MASGHALPSQNVLPHRYGLCVTFRIAGPARPDARPIAAEVVERQALWNRSGKRLIGESMRRPSEHVSIAFFGSIAGPDPAASRSVDCNSRHQVGADIRHLRGHSTSVISIG